MKNKTIISLSFATIGIVVGATLFSSTIFATNIGNIKGNIIPLNSNTALSSDFIEDEIIANAEFTSGLFKEIFDPFVPQLPTYPPQELEGYENFEVSDEVIKDIEVTPESLEKVLRKREKNIENMQESFEDRMDSFGPQLPTRPPQELEGYENFEVSEEIIKDIEITPKLLQKVKKAEIERLENKGFIIENNTIF